VCEVQRHTANRVVSGLTVLADRCLLAKTDWRKPVFPPDGVEYRPNDMEYVTDKNSSLLFIAGRYLFLLVQNLGQRIVRQYRHRALPAYE
jgi:hypothetical protein